MAGSVDGLEEPVRAGRESRRRVERAPPFVSAPSRGSFLGLGPVLALGGLLSLGALLSLAGPSSRTAHATTVAEMDFLAIHGRAATLFHGKCLERTEVTDDGPIPYTAYTFEVVEAVKGCRDAEGETVKRVTFRHAGTRRGTVRPDGLEVPPLRFGVPEYEVGDEVVLFLTPESVLGLCAPVGLSQGTFRVVRSKGSATVASPVGFQRLLKGVGIEAFDGLRAGAAAAVRSPPERMPLDDFLELCRRAKGAR